MVAPPEDARDSRIQPGPHSSRQSAILKPVSLPKKGLYCSIGLHFSGAAPVDRQELRRFDFSSTKCLPWISPAAQMVSAAKLLRP